MNYNCRSCGHDFDLTIDPYVPARTYDPDTATPAEGGTCEPSECPVCGFEVDVERAEEEARDKELADREDDQERRMDR